MHKSLLLVKDTSPCLDIEEFPVILLAFEAGGGDSSLWERVEGFQLEAVHHDKGNSPLLVDLRGVPHKDPSYRHTTYPEATPVHDHGGPVLGVAKLNHVEGHNPNPLRLEEDDKLRPKEALILRVIIIATDLNQWHMNHSFTCVRCSSRRVAPPFQRHPHSLWLRVCPLGCLQA